MDNYDELLADFQIAQKAIMHFKAKHRDRVVGCESALHLTVSAFIGLCHEKKLPFKTAMCESGNLHLSAFHGATYLVACELREVKIPYPLTPLAGGKQ